MIYFDYNATAPVMREAREAWLNITEKIGGNPSSMHQAGTRAAIALADAREKLAICQAYEVPFFTDAVQFIGKMPLKGLGDCDYVSGAAHKFGGPLT